jgi:hypothetical protein
MASSPILHVDDPLTGGDQPNPFEETGAAQEILDPTSVDGRFRENFEKALKIMVHPQTIFDKLTIEDFASAFIALCEIWLESKLPPQDKGLRNFAAFVCSSPPYLMPSFNENEIEEVYVKIRLQFGQLVNYLENVDVPEFNDCVRELTGNREVVYTDPVATLGIIAEMAFYTRAYVLNLEKLASLSDGKHMQLMDDHINWGKFSNRNNCNLNRQQKSQVRLLNMIQRQRLRRVGRDLYKEIITEQHRWYDETGAQHQVGGHYTHAWKSYQTIEKFVGAAFHRDIDYNAWQDATGSASLSPIIEKLLAMTDQDFPDLEKNRHYFSYLDGIYDVMHDDFYSYTYQTPVEVRQKIEEQQQLRKAVVELQKVELHVRDFAQIAQCKEAIKIIQKQTRLRGSDVLPGSLAAAHFIETKFIPDAFNDFEEYATHCIRPADIFAPAWDRILDHQQFYDTAVTTQKCNTFLCENTAEYAVRADSRPRFCEEHRQKGMLNKLIARCSTPKCDRPATYWQSHDQAKRKGLERQKFCDDHKLEGNEPIPQDILNPAAIASGPGNSGDMSVKNIFCAMMGRLFFDIGELDKFQVIPFIKGLANTGKSTLIKFMQNYYAPEDVQVLSNNVEKRFGLEPMIKKFLFVAPEIKDNFGLDQAEFQSMVSGDPMSVACKFKRAITMTWVVPGVLAGNTPPKWADKSGSITRRVLTFPFLCPVRIVDPSIEADLERERAVIQRRCVLAYHGLIEHIDRQENKNIWSVMPQKLLTAREDLQMSTNVLGYFLKQNNEIVVDRSQNRENEWVPWDFFVEKLHAFNLKYHQPVLGKLDPREFVEVFATMDVEMVFDETVKGKPRQRHWAGDGTKKIYKSPFLYHMKYQTNEENAEVDN